MQQETAVLTITDVHWGKKTGSYQTTTFTDVLERLGHKLIRLRDLMNGYDFDRLVIFFLGDMNDGTGIYPTQEHHQEVTNVEQQADQLSDLFHGWLKTQKQVWGDLDLYAVPGNHGRSGKHCHEAASWDMVFYRYLGLKLRPYNIDLRLNEKGDCFVQKANIRGHEHLLYHGHDIFSYAGIPWYGIRNRSLGWLSTDFAPFDCVHMGHFHSFGRMALNRVTCMLNGTAVRNDEWARRALAAESANNWHFFGCSHKHPITFDFSLDLYEDAPDA